jgi:23S rRNA (cytosine1962-C5)-methyltransferase
MAGDGTNAVRLVHSEGDELSGLVVDRYNDVLAVEITNAGLEQLKPLVVETLRQELSPRVIYFKNDLPSRKLERLALEPYWIGDGEPLTEIREHGLEFVVNPHEGQKTGFFLDQRENRAAARSLAAGTRMLNLFAYTGAFGVYAAAGGAASVTNVDISAKAIDMARTNHERNGFGGRAAFEVADAFAWVRTQPAESCDLLVCDPPAFARSRGEVDRAARGYKDINLFAMKLVAPGGTMLTFSCSGHMSLDLFQKVIFAAALDAGRRVSFIQRLGAGPDHPVSLYCPEGEYLKGFLLQVH